MFSKISEMMGYGRKSFNCGKCHVDFKTRLELDAHKTRIHPGAERARWENDTLIK